MKKNIIKILALALVLSMVTPMAGVLAKTFSDVKSDHWAFEPIDKLSNSGIINGYEDGKYRPDENVKFLEVIKLIDGIINPSASERSEARTAHLASVKNLNIADWAQDAVCIALHRKVISSTLLEKASTAGLLKPTTSTYPDRASIATYYAKALKMDSSTDTSILRYDDKASISSDVVGYLVPLVKANILAATGSEGKFSGTRPIKRSEMAKLTYYSYEYTKKTPIAVESTTKEVNGKVTYKTDVNNLKAIIVNTGLNSNIAYNVDDATAYILNGKVATFKDVAEGQEIKITYVNTDKYDSKNLAKKVEITATAVTAIGYVSTKNTDGLQIKYAENNNLINSNTTTQFTTTKTDNFKVDSTTNINLYGKKITTNLNEINIDDMIEFKAESGLLKEAQIFPKNHTVTGQIVKTDFRRDGFNQSATGTVTIKLADKEYTFHLENNRSIQNIERLTPNARVTLKLNYKVIVGVDNDNVNGVFTGQVTNVNTYSNNSNNYFPRPYGNALGYITVREANGTYREFTIYNNVQIIEQNGPMWNVNDLRGLNGRNVRVYQNSNNSNEATKIEILNNFSQVRFTGVVVKEPATLNLGVISYNLEVRVDYSTDPEKVAINSIQSFSLPQNPNLRIGDRVEATGYLGANNKYEYTISRIY